MAEQTPKTAAEAKRRVQILDRELYHLRELQRKYSRRIFKLGLGAWATGVLAFTAAVLLLAGINGFFGAGYLWVPMLIFALSVPNFISAVLVQRLVRKEKKMELLRKNLVEKFEKEMLKRVGKMVTKK